MHIVTPEELELTPDTRPVWRREYDHILERFDGLEASNREILILCRANADTSMRAHDMAKTALWMRSSWGPYIVSALAFAVSCAALALAVRR